MPTEKQKEYYFKMRVAAQKNRVAILSELNELLEDFPNLTQQQLANKAGCSVWLVKKLLNPS